MKRELIEDLEKVIINTKNNNVKRILKEAIQALTSVKSESAEEVEKVIQHEAHEYFKRGQLGFEKAADTERAFYKGAKWMHDFANNSEAMKENAIGFLEWYSMNRYYQMASSGMHTKIGDKNIYTENKLYTIYKESKFASFN